MKFQPVLKNEVTSQVIWLLEDQQPLQKQVVVNPFIKVCKVWSAAIFKVADEGIV